MYFIQSACDVDIQSLHQHFGGHPEGQKVFGSPFFRTFTTRLSSILFTFHARLLILARLLTS